MRLDENGNVVDDPENLGGQEEQQPDPRDAQIAELTNMVKSLSAQVKGLSGKINQPAQQPQNGNQPQGRDAMVAYFSKHAPKYGVDINDKQWTGTIQFLTDVLQDAISDAVKPFAEWKEQAHNAILGLEDEVGFTQFATDPANAKLNRDVLPELRDFYNSKQYFNKPEGHEGQWSVSDGWKRAYKDWSEKQAKLNPQPTTPGRPVPTRPAPSSLSHPKDTRTANAAPIRGASAERFKEDNPDLDEVLATPGGSSALLSGNLYEEE